MPLLFSIRPLALCHWVGYILDNSRYFQYLCSEFLRLSSINKPIFFFCTFAHSISSLCRTFGIRMECLFFRSGFWKNLQRAIKMYHSAQMRAAPNRTHLQADRESGASRTRKGIGLRGAFDCSTITSARIQLTMKPTSAGDFGCKSVFSSGFTTRLSQQSRIFYSVLTHVAFSDSPASKK